MKKVLLWCTLGLSLLLGGAALYSLLESPADVYARVQKYVQQGKWAKIYVNLSSHTKNQIAMTSAMVDSHLKQLGHDSAGETLSNKEKFARTVSNSKALQLAFEARSHTVTSVHETTGIALLTVVVPGEPEPRTIKMVKEQGLWVWELDLSKPNTSSQPTDRK